MAGDAHDPAHCLSDDVVGGTLRVRPGLAEARSRRIDQLRIARVKASPVEAEPVHGAWPEILHQHVGTFQQPVQDREICLGLEIKGDGFLAPVSAR